MAESGKQEQWAIGGHVQRIIATNNVGSRAKDMAECMILAVDAAVGNDKLLKLQIVTEEAGEGPDDSRGDRG